MHITVIGSAGKHFLYNSSCKFPVLCMTFSQACNSIYVSCNHIPSRPIYGMITVDMYESILFTEESSMQVSVTLYQSVICLALHLWSDLFLHNYCTPKVAVSARC